MLSDSQSVEKKSLSARSHEFLPRKRRKSVFLASERVGNLSEVYQGVFYPASTGGGGGLQEITARTFFDPNEVNMIVIGDRIEKYVFFSIRSGV